MNLLYIAIPGAIFLFALSYLNWRRTVKAVLILVVVEGAIRKWILPQASDFIYLVKDLALLGAYARYFYSGNDSKPAEGFRGVKTLLSIATVIIGIQVFNLNLGSVTVGVFGFKAYLLYAPLCFMMRDMFRSTEELKSFLERYLLLIIPVCLLGIVQYYSPIDSPINSYVTEGDVAGISLGDLQRARITGTFSYITGHATYLFLCMALLFPLLTTGPKKIWLILFLGELTLVVGNIFMTGSRAPAFSGLLFFAGFLFFNQMSKGRQERSTSTTLIIAGALGAIGSLYWFGEAYETFLYRATTSDSASERIAGGYLDPFSLLEYAGFGGYGSGSTHPGGMVIRQQLGLPGPNLAPPDAEIETGRVLLELGVIGFAVWYALRFYLIWALWRTSRQLKTPFLRLLALSAFLTHAIQISNQLVLNATFGVYFWFLAGFIFLLPRLDSIGEHKFSYGLGFRHSNYLKPEQAGLAQRPDPVHFRLTQTSGDKSN